MQSKPSRIPRRISRQPSNTSSLSVRGLHGGDGGLASSDTYCMRENSMRLESNYQDSDVFGTSGRNYLEEGDASESSWKLTSPSSPRYSGTFDRPWSGSLGNGSSLSTASMPIQPAWYDESERTQGAYSRLLNQQQDWDSKRPKLSYSGFTSTSGVSSNQHSVSDPSWRYGHLPRSSSVVLASSESEQMRDRRDPDKTTDSSVSSLVDYNNRHGDLSSTYPQDGITTSYSQGARPKEGSLSSLRLNTSSINRQWPSEHPSSFTRDSHRSSSRSPASTAREMDMSQSSTPLAFTHITNRSEAFPINTSSSQQRSGNEPSPDTEGRRTSRQILSRLASSMSSTFFSRRSSQDSLNVRPLESEDSYSIPRAQSSNSSVSASTTDVMDNRSSEPSQGFGFLRRRRGGLSSVSQTLTTDSDPERYRQDGYRSPSSWLSSSFRNRCTPLFSRRRREGRDESARQSSISNAFSTSQQFRSESRGASPLGVQPRSSSTTTANTSPVPAESVNSAGTAAAISDSIHSRRNSGISGILPSSLFRFAVPHGNGSSVSDNVMITVDIVPSLRTLADEQETDKNNKPSRDPEKIKKIQESLLLEDSEEEGDLCRICQMGVASPTNPLIEPCRCTGSLQYVHQDCMKKWLQAKINSGATLDAVTTCELCKEKLKLNLEDFDIHELYRTRANERAEYEFISSGLYLVVLLHLCEQRFSDILGAASDSSTRVRFVNLARTLQAHMEDLETSEDDSEGESDGSRTF